MDFGHLSWTPGKASVPLERYDEAWTEAVRVFVTGIFAKLGIGHEHSEHRRVMAVLAALRA